MTINEKGIINNLTIPELEQIKKVAYEQGRANERVKVIEDFTIKLENAIQEDIDDNVISQWAKGTFMGCVKFVAEQLKSAK